MAVTTRTRTTPLLALLIALALAAGAGFWLLGAEPEPAPEGSNERSAREDAETPEPSGPSLETVTTPDAPAAGDAGERGERTEGTPEEVRGDSLVRVVDALTGEAVPGAYLQLSGLRDLTAGPTTFRPSEPGGPVEIPFEGDAFLVQVAAHRYVTTEVRIDARGPLRVELPRAASLVGVVRDAASAPAAGARITIEYLGPLGALPTVEALPPGTKTLAVTDAEGRFTFTHLPTGQYRATGRLGSATLTSDVTSVEAGAWSSADLWFTANGTVGVTLLGPDGAPSPRSRVMITRAGAEEGDPLLAGYTDADGLVALGPLDPGAYAVTVVSDDGRAKPTPLEIAEGPAVPVNLEIQLGDG